VIARDGLAPDLQTDARGGGRREDGRQAILTVVQESDLTNLAVEFARRGYDAFNEGGVEAILPFLEPDIEWVNLSPGPLSGTYQGHDGVRRFFAEMLEDWESVRLDPEEIIPVRDEFVLAHVRIWARGKVSGVGGDVPVAMLWKIGRTGASQVQIFYNRDDALRAAGLD
jgi:ketosteroid isomerase-like protein